MKPLSLTLVLCLLSGIAIGQAHTPAAPVVDGDEVTIDGSIAWHAETISSTIAQGSTLTLPGVYANSGATDPIIIKMPPGKHAITVLGFPDAGSNIRKAVVQEVTVGQPTRLSLLVAAYKDVEQGKNLWKTANDTIHTMKPTRAEVIAALQALASGQ